MVVVSVGRCQRMRDAYHVHLRAVTYDALIIIYYMYIYVMKPHIRSHHVLSCLVDELLVVSKLATSVI
jgi:hypothetical protein